MDVMEFGRYLKSLREEKGFTLTELGDVVGYSNPYLSQIENGRKKSFPNPELLKKLSEALGVRYFDLMVKAGYWEQTDVDDLIEQRSEKTLHNRMNLQLLQKLTTDYSKLKHELSAIKEKLDQKNLDSKELKKLTEELESNQFEEKMISQRIIDIANKIDVSTSEIANLNKEIEKAMDIDVAGQYAKVFSDLNIVQMPNSLEQFFALNQDVFLNGKRLNEQQKKQIIEISKILIQEEE